MLLLGVQPPRQPCTRDTVDNEPIASQVKLFARRYQTAVRLVIEPIFESGFRDGSYGFRPGRGCHDALREVDRLIKAGYTHVVDADLQSYFDTIPHDALMARVVVAEHAFGMTTRSAMAGFSI